MDGVSRRRFLESVVGAAAVAATVPTVKAGAGASGFRGTLCFFSKHLPGMNARELGRALKSLGFPGVDLTVRPGGHVDPNRVVEDLPPFVNGLRDEGIAVPMITTGLLSASDPAARPTLSTAAALRIPFFKPGYYRYAFTDVRKELDAAGRDLRGLADLAIMCGIKLGYHNHAGYIGGPVWDVVSVIDPLDARSVGYYFDVRHAVVEGGDGGWRVAFNLVAPRLMMIALKDFFWEKTAKGWQQTNCPIGEGMVNWTAFFAALAKTGFAGPVSLHLEYDIPGSTEQAREENTLAAAARDLAFVKGQLAAAYGATGVAP